MLFNELDFFKTYKLYFSLLGDEDGMYEDADEPAEEGEHENGSTPMEESWNIFWSDPQNCIILK